MSIFFVSLESAVHSTLGTLHAAIQAWWTPQRCVGWLRVVHTSLQSAAICCTSVWLGAVNGQSGEGLAGGDSLSGLLESEAAMPEARTVCHSGTAMQASREQESWLLRVRLERVERRQDMGGVAVMVYEVVSKSMWSVWCAVAASWSLVTLCRSSVVHGPCVRATGQSGRFENGRNAEAAGEREQPRNDLMGPLYRDPRAQAPDE